MKTLLLLILVVFATNSKATNYYFSSLSGDDSRTAGDAKNASTPWKTLTKLNAIFNTLKPGDSVLFKRGETFYGTITVNKSGSTTEPIVISAYGTGNKPIITGLQTLTRWTNVGNGIYECANDALGQQVSIVTVNDVEQEMGRYPNSNAGNGGYLNFDSHISKISITDKQLPSSTTWKGAELVVRTNRYIIDRTKITGQSGNTISYKPALTYAPINNFGYFIQNDIRTLDQLGEWYYDPATKKMYMYFGSNSPSDYAVKVSAVENILTVYNFHNIVVDNLSITGGNSYSVYLYSTTNTEIKNCDISFSGIDGIAASNPINIKVENSTVSGSNNIGINLSHSINATIRNNQVMNTAMLKGMGQNAGNKSVGIRETGQHNLIEYNQVEHTGYMGIRFGGDYAIVKNNFVNGFNLTKDDGGGIYTSNTGVGRKVTGNIIVNGIGAAQGTNSSVSSSTSGIYMDDMTDKVEITNNTITNCNGSGIFLHNAREINIQQNTVYDNASEQLLLSHNMTSKWDHPIRSNVLKNNILFAKTTDQRVLTLMTFADDVSLTAGVMDSNYYCRPLDDNFVIRANSVNSAGKSVSQDCDLQTWQDFYKKDKATKKTAVGIIPHRVNALIGANKFANGEFNRDITGVNVNSTGTSFSKAWTNNDIDGGTFQVVTSSTKPGLTTATIPIGAISTSKKYIVGFTVKNSKDTLVYVYARTATAPYRILSNNGAKTILRMTPTRKDYELAFTPKANEENAIIFFETPSESGAWWLDNIRIYEADVTRTNPNDSIRLEYNASQSAKTVALAGVYTDVSGTVYKNSVVLQPFTSLLLIKQNKDAIAPSPNKAPTVDITSPAANSGFTTPADITITATANDADGAVTKVAFYNGNTLLGSDNARPYTFTWKNVPAGAYTITAKATDNDSMETSSSAVTILVSRANIAPTVSITTPVADASFTTGADIVINVKADDADGSVSKVEFYNGNTLIHTETTAPYTWTWQNVAAGNYSLTAKAYDNGSLVTSSTAVTVSVSNANVPPTVSITTPVADASFTTGTDILINVKADDTDGSVSKVEFYNGNTLIHTETTAPYTWTWQNVAAGNYSLTAKAYDNGSLVTSSTAVTLSVSSRNIAPEVSITNPVNNAIYTGPAVIKLSATATDADGSIKKVEFFNGTTLLNTQKYFPYTFSWENIPVGNYVITAVATDDDGSVTTSSAVSFSVIENTPPVVSITSPTVNAGYTSTSTIKMSALASDTDGTIKTVEFFSGTTLLRTERFFPYTYSWENVPAGNYVIIAVATDNNGMSTSDSVSITVTENIAPVVKITSPGVNESYTSSPTIYISASAGDKDGTISKVEFFSGTTLLATEKLVPYTYSWKNVPSGNYTIIAIATDNNGLTSSDTVSISVDMYNRGVATLSSAVSSPGSPAIESAGTATNKILSTQVNSLDALSIKVGPNPASSELSIFTSGIRMSKQLKITVLSISGKALTPTLTKNSDNTIRLNISSLPAGVYLLQVVSGAEVISKQFVKK